MRKISIGLAIAGVAWIAAAAITNAGAATTAPKTTVSEQAVSVSAAGLAPGARSAPRDVPDQTTLVSVEWQGDPNTSFTVETKTADGTWVRAGAVGESDTGTDAGTADATRAASRPQLVSEPLYVEHPDQVRVRAAGGTATDVRVTAIASPTNPGTPAPSLPIAPGAAAIAVGGFMSLPGKRRTGAALVVILIAGAAFVGVDAPKADAAPVVPFPNQPHIVTRGEWGADESMRQRACPEGPEYAQVQLAVIHHTVNSNSYPPSESPAIMRSLYGYFIGTRGYCDLGYNFLIDRFGTIFEGRYGGITRGVIGAHATTFNTGTTGVAMIGDHVSLVPSAATQNAIVQLLAWKFSIHNINPYRPVAFRGAVLDPIIGHRDAGFVSGDGTACPGNAGYSILPGIRNAVRPRVAYDQPYGIIDSITAIPAGFRIGGWAIQRETTAPDTVHFYVDGAFRAAVVADRNRPGLGNVLAQNGSVGYGDNHAFQVPFSAGFGIHTVCGFALGGGNPPIGCRSINVQPWGYLESVKATPTGLVATGWAVNPKNTGADTVHLYVDGVFQAATVADGNRPGLGFWLNQNGFTGYGSSHVFSAPLSAGFGVHTVCAFALGGSNPPIGCRTINVTPFGNLESIKATPTGIVATGWAVNPKNVGADTVHFYVDGRFAGAAAAGGTRAGLGAWLNANGYAGYGDDHTFSAPLSAGFGVHTVCAFAMGATNPPIGCRTINVQPIGYLERTRRIASGIQVWGWAVNPKNAGATPVHFYVDGVFAGAATAGGTRPGLGAWLAANGFVGYGDSHTFNTKLPASAGPHLVCAFALGGVNPPIGCRTV